MFEIEFDAVAKRLTLRLSGFWSDETMARFETALRRKLADAARSSKTFDTLSDARDFPVQSAAVAMMFGQLIASVAADRHGKVAVVVASTLNKMQADRALSDPSTRAFLDRTTALRWLSGDS